MALFAFRALQGRNNRSGQRCALLCAAALLSGAGPVAAQSEPPPARATFEVLDPRGRLPAIERIPLAPRLGALEGRRIAIVKSWPDNSGFDATLQLIADDLAARGARATVMDRNTLYSDDDPVLWRDLHASYDAFVYVAAASSSTTASAFKWAAGLERDGLPGVVVAFAELAKVGDQTNARSGAPLRRAIFDYPPEGMAADDRRAAIEAIAQALTAPLTDTERATGTIPPPSRPDRLLTGDIAEVQERFHELGLTDGLPIVPPTPELVARMLTGTSHSPDEVIAESFPPEGLRATIRDVAVNAVMAGCAPQHLPVLLASLEAFQKYDLNSILRSTNSFSFMQVVNGPVRNEIGMNSGTNAVGPGNRANACMGRALRLFITNLGDGRFDHNLMAVIGSNSNYAFMFAENEEQSPWPTLAEDQGFKRGENVLTLFTGGWAHAGNYGLGTGIEDVPPDLARFQIPRGAVLIVSPARAQAVEADGMSKHEFENYLEVAACRPISDLRQEGRFQPLDESTANLPADTCVPRFEKGTIEIVVAGNDASPMMQAWSMYRPQSVSIDRWR